MQDGKKFLSDLKLYSDYLKWNDKEERYETWEEACVDVLEGHVKKYGSKVEPLVAEVLPSYLNQELLASQRTLQYRPEQIKKHNPRLYNCSTTYASTPDVFSKGFYVLLCGCGLGVNMQQQFIKMLPKLQKRGEETETFVVEDSIEGWADAAKVLISTFVEHPQMYSEYFGKKIRFDYSQIRPEGAYISGGFRAPSHRGLQQSLERIETLLEGSIGTKKSVTFRSIIAYDVFMHLSDAVLSGGVRRSAMNIIMSIDDEELVNAKIGNWRQTHPWRARSNNSVALVKGNYTKHDFNRLLKLNEGDNDLGFVFVKNEYEMLNPCFEIGFNFWNQIENKDIATFSFCNLDEINASACVDKNGDFSEKKFYQLCRRAAILGTLQAGYTDFKFLGKQTEDVVKGEALLGVSITGWMTRPELFNEEILQKGAQIVKETNKEVAKLIGINPAARTTTTKPSGNASVILGTASGIHPEHSARYFRVMQLNKESDTAKYLESNMDFLLEESHWSATNSDYVVYVPIENTESTIYKEDMMGVKHLELIRLVKENWVDTGKNTELCFDPESSHNVSCTVLIDDMKAIGDYVYEHRDSFAAVSFLSHFGDKDYTQAPFTSVLSMNEITAKYGVGAMLASGLIIDALHYFDDLWQACQVLLGEAEIGGTRKDYILRKDWIRRANKFAKNYFKRNKKKMIYCLKDVHLLHKWETINREFTPVVFSDILTKPEYKAIGDYASVACAGGACEVVSLKS